MSLTQAAPACSNEVAAVSNRLANEKSPYLLQHAHNPVDWYPWGEEAFVKARREDKPIFLSIGYSTCHWCHVMAHESFEDEGTSAIMNREFVNIKVDREERPDVDRVYMNFVQATTGGGGWPMSVWLTPELTPFVGGTYFPPQDRHGQPGFKKVLERIAAAWKTDREKIIEQSARIMEALRQASQGAGSSGEIDPQICQSAYQHFRRTFDAREGGFGHAPKFPRPAVFNFLTRFHSADPQSDSGSHALNMVVFTLNKMAAGGIHDHLGGGFHRYSVDASWHVPHFEKMLYDQAQLANAYLDAFQITHDRQFAAIAGGILNYVRRDMTAPGGAFYSAEDADSLIAHGGAEHAEGAFYVWRYEEIRRLLGSSAELFCRYYGVEEEGNVAAASDPQGEFADKNILIQRHSVAEIAKEFGKSESEIEQHLTDARAKLFEARAKRPRPHLDDKIITAWNGLMISAFARAAQVFDDPTYLECAIRATQFIRGTMFDPTSTTLTRTYRQTRSGDGFADDYAFLIQGLLDLYEAAFDPQWLKFAFELQTRMDELFWDTENGGYFATSGDDSSILLRMKDDNDSAEPAASSIAALNLARVAAIRGDRKMEERARHTISAFSPQLSHFPTALPQMLVAWDVLQSGISQIVIAGSRADPATKALLVEVRSHFLPRSVVLLADADEQEFLHQMNSSIRQMKPVKRAPAAYICKNFTCKAPVTTVEALRRAL